MRITVAREQDILAFFMKEDQNELVRHLSIKFINTQSLEVNRAIDAFIASRPWWLVKEEPYDWQV
jgi:hypothetical protein